MLLLALPRICIGDIYIEDILRRMFWIAIKSVCEISICWLQYSRNTRFPVRPTTTCEAVPFLKSIHRFLELNLKYTLIFVYFWSLLR